MEEEKYTTFDDIFEVYARRIIDFDPKQSEEELRYELSQYLQIAINSYHTKSDELNEYLDMENKRFNYIMPFEDKDILTRFMVVEWITANYINVSSALKSRMTSKDFQAWSPQAHLKTTTEVVEYARKYTRRLMSTKTYKTGVGGFADRVNEINAGRGR